MSNRRDSKHVRPRPPSRGRAVYPVKAAAPDRRRVRQHRGMDARRPRAPLATRTLLVLSVAILGLAAFLTASGGIGPAFASIAGGFGTAPARPPAPPLPSPPQPA